jgi:hypothetical protein
MSSPCGFTMNAPAPLRPRGQHRRSGDIDSGHSVGALLGDEDHCPGPCSIGKVETMAKGQKRSNKEVKKPKQVKPKVPGAPSFSNRVGEAQQGGKSPKK